MLHDGWGGCAPHDSSVINFKTKFNSLSSFGHFQSTLDKNLQFYKSICSQQCKCSSLPIVIWTLGIMKDLFFLPFHFSFYQTDQTTNTEAENIVKQERSQRQLYPRDLWIVYFNGLPSSPICLFLLKSFYLSLSGCRLVTEMWWCVWTCWVCGADSRGWQVPITTRYTRTRSSPHTSWCDTHQPTLSIRYLK